VSLHVILVIADSYVLRQNYLKYRCTSVEQRKQLWIVPGIATVFDEMILILDYRNRREKLGKKSDSKL